MDIAEWLRRLDLAQYVEGREKLLAALLHQFDALSARQRRGG